MRTIECSRCGTPTSAGNQPPLCEACKWAVLSHQPVSGPRQGDLGAGTAAAGLAVPAYTGPKAKTRTETPRPRPRGNPTNALLSGCFGATVLAVGAFAFVAWDGTVPWWLFAVLGLGTGMATYRGNEHRIGATARVIAMAVAVIASLLVQYAAYRYLADRAGELPVVMAWDEVLDLFRNAPGPAWWVLPLVAAVAAAASHPGLPAKPRRRR